MDLLALYSSLRAHGCQLIVAAQDRTLAHLECSPFGMDVAVADFNDPQHRDFLELYHIMDGIAFGPRGLPMPSWVLVDLALMSSAPVILAAPKSWVLDMAATYATDGKDPLRRKQALLRLVWECEERGYQGLIPIAGYCAAPTPEPGRWVGWSLCCVVEGMGLGTLVKTVALEVYQATCLDGVTQYDNSALRIHSRFGHLELLAPTVPMHTSPSSFTYRVSLPHGQELLDRVAASQSDQAAIEQASFLLAPGDAQQQAAMGRHVSAGEKKFFILSPGLVTVNGIPMIPIYEDTLQVGGVNVVGHTQAAASSILVPPASQGHLNV